MVKPIQCYCGVNNVMKCSVCEEIEIVSTKSSNPDKLVFRMREMIKEIRRKPIPNKDVIPMLSEAADYIESVERTKK